MQFKLEEKLMPNMAFIGKFLKKIRMVHKIFEPIWDNSFFQIMKPFDLIPEICVENFESS